jgi:hypothetical protein
MLDVSSYLQSLRRQGTWWPMLIGPIAALICVGLSRMDEFFQPLQRSLEVPAPFLVGAAAVIYMVRYACQRRRGFLLLALLATAMTLREIHDLPGMKFMDPGIYISAGTLAVLAIIWYRRIAEESLQDCRHTSWVLATGLAYFLAVLIMRRVFRFVPGEQHIHRSLEECAETVAHVMFIVTSLLATWRKPKSSV